MMLASKMSCVVDCGVVQQPIPHFESDPAGIQAAYATTFPFIKYVLLERLGWMNDIAHFSAWR